MPGGLLADDLTLTYHRPPEADGRAYRGHLLVTTRRHAPDLAALTPEEAAAVGRAAARYAAALRRLGAGRVYSATIGHGVDHLHVHLLPRWPGTPPEVPWHAVDDWPGAPRLTPDEIAALVRQLPA